MLLLSPDPSVGEEDGDGASVSLFVHSLLAEIDGVAENYIVRVDDNDGAKVADGVLVCVRVGVSDGENGIKEFETDGGTVTETDGGAVSVREDDPVYEFVRVRVRVIV